MRGRGGPPDFPRHRRPRRVAPCGGVVWLSWWIGRRLFLARGIRLPRRRHVGPGRRVRPDRLRQPRGLRRAAEAQEPSVHAAIDSVRALTDGSDETASTPKIVSDVAGGSLLQIGRQTLRPPVGGLSARASFPPALHQAAGGWHPAPSYFWPEGRRPSRESPQRHPDRWWPLQT